MPKIYLKKKKPIKYSKGNSNDEGINSPNKHPGTRKKK